MDRLLDVPILEAVFSVDSIHSVNIEKDSVVKSIITILLGCFLSLIISSNISHAVGSPGALNDTGQTLCYDGTAMVECTLANSGDDSPYPRQDGRYGRDAAASAGQLTKIGAGAAGFDYTKIANDGSKLSDSAVLGIDSKDWACTRDNVTGFLWEVKTDDGGVRDKDNTYTWDNAMGSFVTAVNANGLCGFNDWRLPTIKELTGIVHYGIADPGPTIDLAYFPNTSASSFWSASAYAYNSANAWYVSFGNGNAFYYDRSHAFQVRLVRAEQCIGDLTDNLDGTITDGCTGLIWAKCSVGQTYNSGTCTDTASGLTWSQALAAAKNSTLANYSDWRLPNIKELISLVNYIRYSPSIYVDYFPNTSSNYFWSASAYAGNSSNAWGVHFSVGVASNDGKSNAFQVRLVRAGQSFDFLAFNLNISKLGTGSGTVISNPTGINCGSDCSENYANGTSVTLTATAETGSTFAGWSGGGCSGTANTCVVTVSEVPTTVTATFNANAITYLLKVTPAGTGVGKVTSNPAGINCGNGGNDCSENYAASTSVTLTAAVNTGSSFAGWSGGGCSGTAATCVVTMNAAKTVTATFDLVKYSLIVTKTGTGSGTVMSNPSGITCGTDCSENYALNTSVTLTASATTGSSFAGWSGGGCSGTANTCTVTMNAAKTVTATFNANATTYLLEVTKAGTGTGKVTSNPAGITCGSDCNENYSSGTSVTLTAAAETGSSFAGWSGGGCSGTAATCVVTMNAAKTVTATFNSNSTTYLLKVTKAGTGSGTVMSSPSGITCGTDCSEYYAPGTVVTLMAMPTAGDGSVFTGWSGSGCLGAANTCVVTMNATRRVTATFSIPRPAAPVMTSAVARNARVTLKWTAIVGVTSYKVYQGFTAGGESTTPLKTGLTTTSVILTGLNNGTAYFFKLAAVNAGGTGPLSNEVSATPVAPPVAPIINAVAGNGQVTLKWSAVAGATSYHVYQGTTADGESLTPVRSDVTGTSVTILNLNNGTKYFFKMKAANAGGTSAFSNEVSATPVKPPAAPLITAAVAGNTQVTLKWSAVAGATSYKIYRGTTTNGEATTPIKTGVTGTSVILTGLNNGTTYFFKLAAVNAGGAGPLSNEVSATPILAQVDFVITNIALNPASPTANSLFTVTITVKNQGTAREIGGYLDVWADQQTARGCAVKGNAWVDIGILEAGASKNVTVPLTAGSAGSKTLRAFVDSWCEITESDDGNNQLTQVYTVVP
ncbi:hypothetical protein CCP3SC5AM1_1320001 [Gammaproteobacteria bacterium]